MVVKDFTTMVNETVIFLAKAFANKMRKQHRER